MSRVAVVVQARTTSRRLPGKVLLPLAGAPAIVRMMERVARVKQADRCVVATSGDASDDALAETVGARGFAVSRGPLDDVLARVVAAVPEDCDVVVRLTGDCPLVDPALVDRHVERFLAAQPHAEYVSNALAPRTQPDGLDVEVTSRAWLARAAREARDPADREHVTPWVRRHARCLALGQIVDLSALRWTLDTRADYEAIAAIYARLFPRDPAFDSRSVYELLAREPALLHTDAPAPIERDAWVARIREHLAQEPA